MNYPVDLENIIPAWCKFRAVTGISTIQDDAQYQRMTDILNALLDEAGGDEQHPAMPLADIVGDLIADYETTLPALPEATGVDALKFLMTQHGLRQHDLPEIGSQGVVSEILSGKRALNVRQVRRLADRFHVSPGTFV